MEGVKMKNSKKWTEFYGFRYDGCKHIIVRVKGKKRTLFLPIDLTTPRTWDMKPKNPQKILSKNLICQKAI